MIDFFGWPRSFVGDRLLPISLTSHGKADMPPVEQTLLAGACLAATNGLAWVSDFSLGSLVTSLSTASIGGLSLYWFLRDRHKKKLWEEEDAEIKRKNAHRLEQYRIDAELQKQKEKDNTTSLIHRLNVFQASMNDMNTQLSTARKSLHDQRNEHQAQQAQHALELHEVKQELRETKQEVHDLRLENEKFRAENRRLLDRIEAMQGQSNAMMRVAEDNSQKIDDLTSKVANPQ